MVIYVNCKFFLSDVPKDICEQVFDGEWKDDVCDMVAHDGWETQYPQLVVESWTSMHVQTVKIATEKRRFCTKTRQTGQRRLQRRKSFNKCISEVYLILTVHECVNTMMHAW